MPYSWIERGFRHTSLFAELYALGVLYAEMDTACTAAAEGAGAVCSDGCGSCCVNFEPDILPHEADFIASYLIAERPEYLASFFLPRPAKQCPFYIASSAAHCGIYPARPSICRLFGFSGVQDKYGNPEYRPCRHMRPPEVPPRDAGNNAAAGLPLMSVFGIRNTFSAAHGSRSLRPLSPAVASSLERLRYLLYLHQTAGSGRTDPGDNSFDDRPDPRAA